jgi:hypothetical protein
LYFTEAVEIMQKKLHFFFKKNWRGFK